MSGPVFVVTGDSHIGKGSHLYPERLAEQEAAWSRTLELARDRDALAVLHAGDLFDKRRPTPSELVAAVRPLVKHREYYAGSPQDGPEVHVIPGNHDPVVYGPGGLDVLDEAGVATVHRTPSVIEYGRPFGDAVACVAMLPWAPTSRLVAERGGRDGVSEDAGELVARVAEDLYREIGFRHDVPNILLGHWSVEGGRLPNGLPVERLSEPVVPADVLELGFDAYAFGHIHRAGDIGENRVGAGQPAIYTGSPIALDHGEAGVDHGAWVYDVDAGTFELVDLGGRPFVTVTMHELERAPIDGAIVRVRDVVPAGRSVDPTVLRDLALARGAVRVDLALDVERESKPLMSAVDTDREPIHLLADYLGERAAERQHDDERLERLLELADTYLAGERVEA